MGSPALDVFDGFVDAELRIDFQKQMNMIWHDFHFQKVNLVFPADSPTEFLETDIDSIDKDFTPILRTKHDMILAGVNNIVVRPIFYIHACIIS